MDPATLESLIVREIRKTSGISRRDLADRLGIAKSTAGRRVDSLIERGLLRESGLEQRAEAGRPRRLLELEGGHGSFAGLDFDARQVYAVLVDFAKSVLVRQRLALPPRPDRQSVLERLRSLLAGFRQQKGAPPLLGTGIAVPGRIDGERRLAVDYPYIAGWEGVDLLREMDEPPERLHIENNTRAIALGEYWLGGHAAAEHLVCLNVRTGVSAAVISGGRLLTGRHGMAGEIRAWRVESASGEGGAWLEEVATARSVGQSDPSAPDAWEAFAERCRAGEAAALDQLRRIARHHGETAARIVQLADPEAVVLSGNFVELGSLYLDPVREAAAAALEGHYFQPPPVEPAAFGEFAAARGAAALAAERHIPL